MAARCAQLVKMQHTTHVHRSFLNLNLMFSKNKIKLAHLTCLQVIET